MIVLAYLGDGQGRTPLFFEDIQTYAALAVDIGMVYLSKNSLVSQSLVANSRLGSACLCLKLDFGRFEWVVWREMNHYKKHST